MTPFLSSNLAGLVPYVPGEQPQDKRYIKLNTNESPYPPSPRAVEAAKSRACGFNLYSDPTCAPLKRQAAVLYGLEECNVSAGNGSDEVLAHIFRAFFGDCGAAFPDITYGFYPVLCSLLGIRYKTVPLRKDFTVDIADYSGISAAVVLANPNAQTGIYLEREQIEKLVLQNPQRLVIIDEAYIDFGGRSCAPLVTIYPNLIVVQTLSKSRSLAGARVGLCFADKELISAVEAVRCSFNPYNVNSASMYAAAAALGDVDYFKECTQKIISVREYAADIMKNMGFEVLPSRANFLLVRHGDIGGEKLYLSLKERGILVRHFSDKRIEDFIRVSIGTRGQMDEFLKSAGEILAGGR